MKFNKNNTNNIFINLSDLNITDIEEDKILRFKKYLCKGIKNYCCFQKYSFFNWPLWVQTSKSISTSFINQVIPLTLLNNSIREWNCFTNFLSNEDLYIDPSGMFSTSYDDWSLEIWLNIDDKLYRPRNYCDNVKITRDNETSIIQIKWEEEIFQLVQTIYGARSSVDEAIVDIECNLKAKFKNASMLIVIRPYNHLLLGGINKISYNNSEKLIFINNKKRVGINKNPQFILTGNGEKGDIESEIKGSNSSINCKNGMATIALGYKLGKSKNLFSIRVSLDSSNDLKSAGFNYENVRKDYESYAKIRIENGIEIKIKDPDLINLFLASKISVLNFSEKDLYIEIDDIKSINCRAFYFILYGYNRMGYFTESKRFIDLVINKFKFNDKSINFSDAVNLSYILIGFADYFIHTRDSDYIQLNYNNYFRDYAAAVYKFTSGIKNINNLNINSIDTYLLKKEHCFDIILFAYSMDKLSYLARCIGIFGDEKKFGKESERLAGLFKKHMAIYGDNAVKPGDDFYYYELYSGFPFRLKSITDEDIALMINRVINNNGESLINNKTLGLDVFSSIILSNCMLLQKDERAFHIINDLMEIISKSCSMPEYINAITKKGSWGDGYSKILGSILFSLIRNTFFVDMESRLDLFPIASEDWFKAGKEIVIKNAPSRFGYINFRMKATTNEIQFFFDELPKYVPPDIMINIPFKVKILEADDFIVKKVINNSFIINGWPTQVKFLRKK